MKKGTDYIGVGCGVVIENEKGEILLGLRGKNVRNEAGKWCIPGGGVEFGEKRSEAAIREAKEEFGCEVEIIEELGTIDHFIPSEEQHWITTTFLCRIKDGVPTNMEPEKCERIQWVSHEEISTLPLANNMKDIIHLWEQSKRRNGTI